MGTTPSFNFPYPELTDPPHGPDQIQALAEAVEAALTTIISSPTFGGNVGVNGNLAVVGSATVGSLNVGGQAWSGAWQTFSPNWTAASGTAPSIGNGTLTAKYLQLGKTVVFNIVLVGGSSTQWGNGGFWQFALPVAAANGFAAAASYRDNSVPLNLVGAADCRPGATPTAIIRSNVSSGGGVTNTAPFTWTTDDTYKVSGVYEAA